MLNLVALVALGSSTAPKELYEYLSKSDAAYASTVQSSNDSECQISLTSQEWHGITWKHNILVRKPANPASKDTAILFITGDGPRAGDYTAINMATQLSKLPVAMLFDIPNQPLWDHREDDLIGHTFEQYLRTGDASWPLLFPMTKSAIRAMDAVQAAMPNIKRFVVTGASKRGWTTWFVGAAGDKRVIAIAPMVIDNLNIPAQMPHQLELWGEYSIQIKDYTTRGLQQQLATPRGQQLVRMVDPYFYRSNIKVPTLIVKGGNDQYWTPDALNLYWSGLQQPKWVTTVPNAGHNLGDGVQAISAIAAFAQANAANKSLPCQGWKFSAAAPKQTVGGPYEASARICSSGGNLDKVVIWGASTTGGKWDIAHAHWSPLAETTYGKAGKTEDTINFKLPLGRQYALYAEFRYTDDGQKYSLCTPTELKQTF